MAFERAGHLGVQRDERWAGEMACSWAAERVGAKADQRVGAKVAWWAAAWAVAMAGE